MHRVVALAAPGIAPFELGIVVEVFGLDRPELDVPWWYELTRRAPRRPGRCRRPPAGSGSSSSTGSRRSRTPTRSIVPGWHGEPSPQVVEAVRAAHARGARLVSICSGVFLLAATGLLDGREAATHWRYARAARRPPSRASRSTPTCSTSTTASVLTSAGSAAGIDLCLHIVRRDHGSAVANAVARRLVIPPHRDGGQAQLIDAADARAPRRRSDRRA